MKKALLIIFTFISFIISAQNDTTICSKIIRKVDDFTNDITLMTPFSFTDDKLYNEKLYKITKGTNTVYLLRLNTTGITLNIEAVNVIILFTDGTKLSLQTKVVVEVGDNINTWEYHANIHISLQDLDVLSKKNNKEI